MLAKNWFAGLVIAFAAGMPGSGLLRIAGTIEANDLALQ